MSGSRNLYSDFLRTWSPGESGGISQRLPCGTMSSTEILRVVVACDSMECSVWTENRLNLHSTLTCCLILSSAVSNRTQSNRSFTALFVLMQTWRWPELLFLPVMSFQCRTLMAGLGKEGSPLLLLLGSLPIPQRLLLFFKQVWQKVERNEMIP